MSSSSPPTDRLQTVEQCLEWVHNAFQQADLYYGHGTDNAWDEAVALVLFVMQLSPDSDHAVLKNSVTDAQRQQILSLTQTRINKHIPLPYLTHQAWFMGLPFYVDERVLIPRSPFAEWIARECKPWVNPDNVHRVCEIGTGSGCIAIAIALTFPDATVDAVDIDKNTLAVAQKNVAAHHVQSRVNLIESDCFDALGNQHYDLIVSNPPYVGRDEMHTLPDEYRAEPRHALEAEENGLSIAITILKNAAKHLTEHGVLMLEVGNSDEALAARFPNVPFTWLEQTHGGHGLCVLHKNDLTKMES